MSEPRQLLLILTLLAIMGIAAVLGARHRAAAVLLGLSGLVWLLVDTSWEGRTLWVISSTHGLTSSDLVGLAGILVAAVELVRLRR